MFQLSASAKSQLTKSHRIQPFVEIYYAIGDYPILWSSTWAKYPNLLDGEVGIRSGFGVRRNLNCRLIDTTGELTAVASLTASDQILHPWGREIRAYRSLYLADGSIEQIPLGVFGISGVEISDGGTGVQIAVQAYDRSRLVADSRLIQDYVIVAGTKYTEAIKELILRQVPQVKTNFIDLPYTTPVITIKAGEDPWAAAQKMASSIGCELFFNVVGECILRVIPNYDAIDVDWVYAEGPDATLLSTNKRLTSDGAFNYYIFTGEGSSNTAPVRGDAYDDNPQSATYWKGPYGTRPAPVERSKLITTTEQANAAASGALNRSIGYSERVHFNAIVNAAHDVGDVVQITRAKSKINGRYILEQLSVPLSHNRAMDCVTRFRQEVT